MFAAFVSKDLCLSLLRDYLTAVKASRPWFKVVVMSASIDKRIFSEYFDNCPTMDCPGQKFHVEDVHVPLEDSTVDPTDLCTHAVNVLFDKIVAGQGDTEGDVLIFLSGASDIDACVSKIRARAKETGDLVVAFPLYSKLDQSALTAATDRHHRSEMTAADKVIVCTNIAETSLTIDGVRFVIESGRANKVKYDHELRCSVLSETFVSRASTIQRRGRAGRTSRGICYYLYSEDFHKNAMVEYDTPNIMEECVDRLLLFSMHVCGRSLEEMGLLDAPTQDDILEAKQRLIELGFLEQVAADGQLSLTGEGEVACALSSLRPESVRMILNGLKAYPQCAKRIMTLAVLMSGTESIFNQALKIN
jgi:HrpA-like RNA helicase